MGSKIKPRQDRKPRKWTRKKTIMDYNYSKFDNQAENYMVKKPIEKEDWKKEDWNIE